jgi:hypothetical protein
MFEARFLLSNKTCKSKIPNSGTTTIKIKQGRLFNSISLVNSIYTKSTACSSSKTYTKLLQFKRQANIKKAQSTIIKSVKWIT